jgi:hypothetical protein
LKSKISKEEAQNIFEEYSSYVFKVALFLSRSTTLADDITQETFIKIFENCKANEKVIVIQQLVAHLDSKISYSKDSKILNNFGGDLAVLTDLKKGRKELYIYHKESNGNITEITIFSNADVKVMENFAQKYLKGNINYSKHR